MLDALISKINTLLNDPYGILFILCASLFLILYTFQKLTKIFVILLTIASIYLIIMYFGNKPAPNLPETIKNPIQLTFQSFKDWSKNQIWKKASQ